MKINSVKKIFLHLLLVSTGTIVASSSQAQQLMVGDAAPELKYSQWIKGKPITSYEPNHLYVFEFWATWCGPCKAAMPHLSELARKYKDSVTFVGVNILEQTKGKPYESSLPAVTKFVNGMGKNMDYSVIADNNDQHMSKNWMTAAGQGGIPATFLVRNGKLIWIGPPERLDSLIPSILAGKYDLDAEVKKADASPKSSGTPEKKAPTPLAIVYKAIQDREFVKASSILDTLKVRDQREKTSFNYMKFLLLLEQRKLDETIAFAKEWLKETPVMVSYVGGDLLERDGLSKEAYLYGVEVYRPLLSQKNVAIPTIYNVMATGYAKAGDFKSAREYQEMAIKSAKGALKEGKYIGTILDYTITEYQEKLTKYKKNEL